MGRRPILSYASYIHYNWKRTDPNKGIVLENLELNQKLQGGVHEKWFVLVHVEIEAIASKMLLELRACIADGLAPENLQRAFETVTSGIMQMIQTFKRMDEHCTPYEYYHQVRPYIFGFDDLEFEGIPGVQAERMFTLRGQAASQSSIIPSLVAFLGIQHHESGKANHLADTRTYMPKEHQKIILGFVQPNVREVVLSAEKSDDLIVAYNDAINTLSKFRSLHLANVKRYIFEFSQDENDLGTGKTVFLKWLAKLRDETNAALISV